METNNIPSAPKGSKEWLLVLYVAGDTNPSSATALSNLKKFGEAHLAGQYRIEIVDLLKNPERAREDNIFAIPTMIRTLPEPIRKFIGDFSDTDSLLLSLEIEPDK